MADRSTQRWTARRIRDLWSNPPVVNGKKVAIVSAFKQLLRRLWNDQTKWDKCPNKKNEVLAELLNTQTGLVSKSMAIYQLQFPDSNESVEVRNDRRLARQRQTEMAFKKRATEAQREKRRQIKAQSRTRTEMRRKNGIVNIADEAPDVKEIRLWQWLRDNVIRRREIRWEATYAEFSTYRAENSYQQIYEGFDERHRELFWTHCDQLVRYVAANGGDEAFHGTTSYHWNVIVWWSVLLRSVHQTTFNGPNELDCMDFHTAHRYGDYEDYTAIGTSVRGCKSYKQITRALNILYNCTGNLHELVEIDTSHLCNRGTCVNVRHMTFENRLANLGRISCGFGSRMSCRHNIRCIFVNISGVYLSCKNSMFNECVVGCELGCFVSLSSLLPLNEVSGISFVICSRTKYDRIVADFDSQSYRSSLTKEQLPMHSLLKTALNQFVRFVSTESNNVRLPTTFDLTREKWMYCLETLVDKIRLTNDGNSCVMWPYGDGFDGQYEFNENFRPSFTLNRMTVCVARFFAFLMSANEDRSHFFYCSDASLLEGSHLCNNGQCVHPNHFVLETRVYNRSRMRCRHGSIATCPHEPSCLFTTF